MLFRKKAMDKISTPDELRDYIHVVNPGVWMALSAILVLLIGALIWARVSSINTYVSCVVSVNDGKAVVYYDADMSSQILAGQSVKTDDFTFVLDSVDSMPLRS